MAGQSLKDYLYSSDPLSEEAISFLLTYKEEDPHIDFKENMDTASDKEWLELTKDAMAFTNAEGGYIVFGVRNATWELVGLESSIAEVLANTDVVLQKLNRCVEPDFMSVRSKRCTISDREIVVVNVPQSETHVHVVSKDAFFKHKSGEKKVILHKGTFYVRRSAGNHLADSRDISDIIARRLATFRESLVGKLRQVVESPSDSEIFVVTPDPTAEADKRFVITGAPDAIPVKGMSFSVAPSTTEQEIAAAIAMWQKDRHYVPPSEALWRWYLQRQGLGLDQDHRIRVAAFCLIKEAPFFFWLQGCSSSDIQGMLLDIVSERVPATLTPSVVGLAAFVGKGFHTKIVRKLESRGRKLYKRFRVCPSPSPRVLFGAQLIEGKRAQGKKVSEQAFRENLEKELNDIAAQVETGLGTQPSAIDRSEALALDCYLYARDDKYQEIDRGTNGRR